jgi:4-amino-4-deoxy-L-arabinose transferase-like glycosyltransferase
VDGSKVADTAHTATTAGKTARGVAWLLLLLPLFVLGQRHILWGADEPREAEIAREAYASGDWAVPRLNGAEFLEKPPLAQWGAVLVFRLLGGPSESWCRLSSALWGAVGTAACAWLGWMLFGWRVGVLAAFVLATSQEWLLDTHTLLVDVPLAAGVAVTFACLWHGYRAPVGRRKAVSYLLAWVACGVAFLAKGAIGVALPAAGVLTFLIWRREGREGRRILAPLNLAVFLAVVAPWLVTLVARSGAGALRTFFVDNTLMRFVSPSADHAAPPWDYAVSIFGVTLPWALFLPPVIVALARPGRLAGAHQRLRWQYLAAITVAPFLLLSVASAKRPVYLLPLLPGLAIAIAAWLDRSLGAGDGRVAGVWRVTGTSAFAAVAVGGWVVSTVLALGGHRGVPLAFLGLAAALGTAIVFVHAVCRGRSHQVPSFAAAFALLVTLSLSSPAVFRRLESRRGYRTLTAALSGAVQPGTTLYGYGMGERELGVACFHERATIPQVRDPEAFRRVLQDGEAVVLVAGEVVTRLQASHRWPASAVIVARPRMRTRPFVLVRGAARSSGTRWTGVSQEPRSRPVT